MKTKSLLVVVAGSSLALSALLVFSQQFRPPEETPPDTPPPPEEAPRYFIVNRATWEVSDPFNTGVDLTLRNTPEMKQARYRAVLAIEAPEEYAALFPPTKLEEFASKVSAKSIEHPISLKKYLKEPRPRSEQDALEQVFRSAFGALPEEEIKPNGKP